MSLHEPTTRAPETVGDHQDQPGDRSRVVVGAVVSGPAFDRAETASADVEDRSPGEVEARSGAALETVLGAAFTVTKKAGTAVVWTSGGAWTLLRWTGSGTRATTVLAYRYVRALDVQEDIGGKTSKSDYKLVKSERRDRWKVIGITALSTLAVDVGAWVAMVRYAHIPALHWESWGTAPGLECSLVLAGVAAYGRYRINAGLAAGEFVAPEDLEEEDENEPYPLAHATDGDRAADCLSRAMYAANLHARQIVVTKRFEWGWEFDVLLRGGTKAAKVLAAAEDLEANMHLRTGGFLTETDPGNAAHIVVRAVQDNPFANMPRPAVHAPNSLSIHQIINMGRAMDGGPLPILLDGFFALVVGAMGAGKTLGALRTLAEAITACVDAIAWDLDPAKDGLSEFGGLMAERGRGPQECEELLEKSWRYIEARARIFRKIGMGDRWKATRKHPAVFIFVDEVTRLTPRGKQLLIDGLRVGRQLGIWFIIAGQEATEDALGDAIGSIIAYRILLSCRPEDTRICFPGKSTLGWTPHRLVASTGTEANDAGTSYIMGGPLNRPIQYRFDHYAIGPIQDAVPERLEAGRPVMDADTRREAGEDVTDDGREFTLADRLDALHSQGGVHDAAIVAELLRLYGAKSEPFLPTALLTEQVVDYTTADDKPIDGDRLGRLLRAHAPGVAAVRQPWLDQPQVRGWLRDDVERAARGLIDPAKARLEAD